VKDAVLSAMKSDQAQCTSVVSWGKLDSISQMAPMTSLTSGEMVKQQICLIGKLEDAIRQHERASAEKQLLKKNVKTKEEENKKLKSELIDNSLKLENKTTDTCSYK
jgi:hypothetical protein